jgi:hypothetical protein
LAGSGLVAGHALGQSVPIPGVTTTTLPSTTLPVPVPTVPTLPTLPTPTVSTPSAPVPVPTTATTRTTPTTTTGATATAPVGSSASNASGSAATTSAASAASGASSPGTKPTRTSTSWISTKGPRHKRTATLTFRLPRAARVVFVVQQVSPVCRVVRRFKIKGHAGKNRVRISARTLDVGTYRISATTITGRLVRRTTLIVLVDRTPTRAQIAAAQGADVCASSSGTALTGGSTSLAPGQAASAPSGPRGTPSTAGFAGGSNARPSGVLGSTVAQTAHAIRPWLVALLAFAIALFAIGSMPQLAAARDAKVNELLARHRTRVVALGAVSFVAVIVAFLLG